MRESGFLDFIFFIKPNYANLKTQCAFEFARLAKLGAVKIATDDAEIREKIVEEISQLKRKNLDREGKIFLVSKEEIKEKIGRSPDFLDAILMRFYFEIARSEMPQIFVIWHFPPIWKIP